jgi:hypothetical protein
VEDEVDEVSEQFGENLSRQKVAALVKERGKLEAEIVVDEALLLIKRQRLAELESAKSHLAYVMVMRATAARPKRIISPKVTCVQEAKRPRKE